MYRAAVFMVEDAITNPTSPMHKGTIAWKDLRFFVAVLLRMTV